MFCFSLEVLVFFVANSPSWPSSLGSSVGVTDQLRGRDDGRSDFEQVIAMRIITRRVGEHQFDEAEDDH